MFDCLIKFKIQLKKMKLYRIIILILLVSGLSKCKVVNKVIVGKYIETAFGDTLQINNDQSYEYLEKLNNGTLGWTQGKWIIKNRKIYFQCDHQPLVGYRLKVRPDTLLQNFQIKLLLGDTDEPINIENVCLFKNNLHVDANNFKQSTNVVTIFTTNFDSIVIHTSNFTPLSLPNILNTNHGNIARIYPVERLYALDKVPFSINKNILKSRKTKAYQNIFLTFKKIDN